MDYKYRIDHERIAKKVKALRLAHRLTQEEFAEKIDISANGVSKLEINRMTIGLKTLIRIANLFQVDINYFLMEDGKEGEVVSEESELLYHLIPQLSEREKRFLLHVMQGMQCLGDAEGDETGESGLS